MAEGIECYRIQFPQGHGRQRVRAARCTPAAKSLGSLIRKAVWLGKGAAPPKRQAQRDVDERAAAEAARRPSRRHRLSSFFSR